MASRSVCPQFVRGSHNIRVTPVQRHNGDSLTGLSAGTTLNLVRRPRPVGLGSLRRTAIAINQSFPAPVLQISPNNSHLEFTHMSSPPNDDETHPTVTSVETVLPPVQIPSTGWNTQRSGQRLPCSRELSRLDNGDTLTGPSAGTTLNLVRRPRPVGLGSLRRRVVAINQSFPAPVLQISPNNSHLESTHISSSPNNGDTPNGPSVEMILNLVPRPRPVSLDILAHRVVARQTFPAQVQQISENNNDLESTNISSSLNNNAEDANVENDKFESSSGVDHSFMNQCIENELQCNICQEIFFKPTVLNCTHTFCYVCIESWTRIKNQCPLCRAPVTNTTYCRSLDTFLDKITPLLSKDIQSKRQTRMEEYN